MSERKNCSARGGGGISEVILADGKALKGNKAMKGRGRTGGVLLHEEVSGKVLRCAMAVHSHLGPGLLESVYRDCLVHELGRQELGIRREAPIPITYQGTKLDCGFRADIIVNDAVLIELKAVEKLLPIHEAQVLTYLKLSGLRVGLLLNFNVVSLRHGLRRLVR